MKKLLSLIGSLGMAISSISPVISCSKSKPTQKVLENEVKFEQDSYNVVKG